MPAGPSETYDSELDSRSWTRRYPLNHVLAFLVLRSSLLGTVCYFWCIVIDMFVTRWGTLYQKMTSVYSHGHSAR